MPGRCWWCLFDELNKVINIIPIIIIIISLLQFLRIQQKNDDYYQFLLNYIFITKAPTTK